MRHGTIRAAGLVLAALAHPVGPAAPAVEKGDLAALAHRVRPSVVEVLGTVDASGETSYGTGFVLGRSGLVVTNAHVVRGVSQVMVRTIDGALLASVEVLEADADVDIAVLRVTGLTAPPLEPAPAEPSVGTRVLAVGHPRGYEFTVSDGIVSALRTLDARPGLELIQTTAPISPGSSGGPLVDLAGRVVGVCSMTLMEGQNINFAVPVRTVLPVVDRALALERALSGQTPPDAADPGQLAAWIRRYRMRGQLVRAGELTRRALARHPRSLPLLVEAAEVAWARDSLPELEAFVRQMRRVDPDYGPALQLEAVLLAESGRCDEALEVARRALAGGLESARAASAHAVLADCLARAGRAEQALEHLDRALEDPGLAGTADWRVLRAFLLDALGRADEADREAVAALESSAWDPVVRSSLRERGLPRLVEVVSHRAEKVSGTVVVRGVVRNRGPLELADVEVLAEGLDADGVVVATGTAVATPSRLVPGQSASFRVVLGGIVEDVAEIEVRVVDFDER